MDFKEQLTRGKLKTRVYEIGLRLMNSGLDAETVYARLLQQRIPADMAKEVVQGLVKETKREKARQEAPALQMAFIKIGIGAAVALLSFFIFPDHPIVPIGMMLGGIGAALLAAKKV